MPKITPCPVCDDYKFYINAESGKFVCDNCGTEYAGATDTRGLLSGEVPCSAMGLMNAEEYLKGALGGNMNISTLKPLAWHEIMEAYAKYRIKGLGK